MHPRAPDSLPPPSLRFSGHSGSKKKALIPVFHVPETVVRGDRFIFPLGLCDKSSEKRERRQQPRPEREKKQKQPPCGKNVNGQENSGRGSGLGGAQGGDASCDALRNGSRKLKKLANALTFGSLLLHFLDCSWRFSLATRYSRKTRVYSGS